MTAIDTPGEAEVRTSCEFPFQVHVNDTITFLLGWWVRKVLLLSIGGFALGMLTYAGYTRLTKDSRNRMAAMSG